jgi:inorganic triphosphatase YgiF
MHEELELKLAVTPDELKRLRRDPLIRSLAHNRASTKRLHTTYFDTPSLDLQRRGMALRVRRVGKRRVQTLKVPGKGAGGLQHYREYEAEVAADTPDIERIDDANLRRLFAPEGVISNLKPVFTTAISRSSVPLKLEDSEVELALDSGEISAGGKTLPICEAELELVAGSSERIYELALALHKRIAFRLETRTKAARGYHMSADHGPAPQKATALELDLDMTVGDAFLAAARNCLKQIRVNEAVVLLGREGARDPEGIHQLRIGVRRLRALVTVFKKALSEEAYAFLRAELAWLQGALGPAREWDVFVLETLAPLRRRRPEDSDLTALVAAADARRELANQAAIAALLRPRYTDLLLRLELWLDNGGWQFRGSGNHAPDRRIGRFAAEVLERRADKLHKLTGKWKTLPEAELHEVRILAKKLRYTAEFFQALYPRKMVRAQLQAVARIQDTLGSLNDAVVTDALLADLDGAVAGCATAIVRGWQSACIERDLAHFRDALKRYEKQRAPWT